ncbi:hypothetical protein D3H55_13960 [Bacillus salacetis]|uniref:Lipoprotein n=1 Tax=Bacillus salacetis TaxID=2315464 RepID=A0A3A1QV95_9BACI|nr:hypothetical protein [Bacillus salacetis]RIW31983.1 hypothetical protein D3H55_13960 [Bacillus salacetis]
MKMKHILYFIVFVCIGVLSACSQDPEFDVYEGKALNIAVIGEPPVIEEEQVRFKEIAFDELNEDIAGSYDAVFITERNLSKASESQFAEVYLASDIPFFFLSANNHIPFTIETESYSDSWKWSKGTSYAVGILPSEKDDSLKTWGFSLYND